ncbi:unnamed protein product, partial [Iphiclides podalirius]
MSACPRRVKVNSDVTRRHDGPIKSRFYPHKFGQLTACPHRGVFSAARFQPERDGQISLPWAGEGRR